MKRHFLTTMMRAMIMRAACVVDGRSGRNITQVVSLFHGRGSQPHHRAEVLPLLNHTGLTRKVGSVAE